MHHFSLGLTSFLNAVPTNLGVIFSGLILTFTSNYLVNKGWLRKVNVRRLGGVLIAASALYLIGLGYLPCRSVNDNIVALMLVNSFRSGFYISVFFSLADISPTYQDSLMTACTIAQFVPGFLVPMVMSQIGKNTREQWQHIFLLSAAIIGSSVGFYLLAATDEVLDFDKVAVRGLMSGAADLQTSFASPPMPSLASTGTLRGGREMPTRVLEKQGQFSLNVGVRWAKNRRNVSRSIWNMADDFAIEAILEQVETDLRSERQRHLRRPTSRGTRWRRNRRRRRR